MTKVSKLIEKRPIVHHPQYTMGPSKLKHIPSREGYIQYLLRLLDFIPQKRKSAPSAEISGRESGINRHGEGKMNLEALFLDRVETN